MLQLVTVRVQDQKQRLPNADLFPSPLRTFFSFLIPTSFHLIILSLLAHAVNTFANWVTHEPVADADRKETGLLQHQILKKFHFLPVIKTNFARLTERSRIIEV